MVGASHHYLSRLVSIKHTINSSYMCRHYGAFDTDFSWGLKLRAYPQLYNVIQVQSIG
ncbi:MAG: hypothetical protein ACJATI_000205 [Halioglobus sp.]|jgi:hypothetical protein